MPCPSHPPRLDHSNYAWRRVRYDTVACIFIPFSPLLYRFRDVM
jgi:hypothetical protein